MLKRGDIFILNEKEVENVDIRKSKNKNLSDLSGEYVVTRTRNTGGGYGHGKYDYYPDGSYVTARKIGEEEISIGFFQSGCFENCLHKNAIKKENKNGNKKLHNNS